MLYLLLCDISCNSLILKKILFSLRICKNIVYSHRMYGINRAFDKMLY